MTDPICDIVEVTANGTSGIEEIVGHVVDVTASGSVDVTQSSRQLVSVAGVGAAFFSDIPKDLVIATAIGHATVLDHLSAANFVTVRGIGATSTHERLKEIVSVAGVGDVAVYQTSLRDLVRIAANGVIAIYQARTTHQFVSVAGKGKVSVEQMARELVDVAANGANAVFDHLFARSFVSINGIGSATLFDGGTFRDFLDVRGAGSSMAFDHLHAIDTVSVDGEGDAEIVIPDDEATTLAWSAPTDGFGMSQHAYPRGITGLAEIDGIPFAVGPAGAYLIVAADDVGIEIDAHVKGAMYDGGDAFLKRGLAVYVTYTSDKPIGLSVGTPQTGVEVTYDYVGTIAAQSAPRPVRVAIGKGIRSRMLRFTIHNTEGGGLTVMFAEPDTFDTGRRT